MPPERTEDTAQPNLAIAFLRLGSWEDYSLVRKVVLFNDMQHSLIHYT